MSEEKSKLQLIGEIAEANNKNLELIEEIDRLNNLNKQLVEECQRLDDEETRLNNIISQIETLVINHNCDTGDIYYKYNGKYLKSGLKERIIELVELKENK